MGSIQLVPQDLDCKENARNKIVTHGNHQGAETHGSHQGAETHGSHQGAETHGSHQGAEK